MFKSPAATALGVTVITVVFMLAAAGVAVLALQPPKDPIQLYLDEVYAAAERETGTEVPENDPRINTAALLAGALTCGLKDDPLMGQGVRDSVNTNELAAIAMRYCDTAFNDPLTDEERARYGVMVPTPAPPVSSAIPAPPEPEKAVTDAQDAVGDAADRQNSTPFTGYTCEPDAPARMDDPANPNVITNKACDDLNSAKEKAHRDFGNQTWMDGECIGYGCSPEQDAEINRFEREANSGEN